VLKSIEHLPVTFFGCTLISIYVDTVHIALFFHTHPTGRCLVYSVWSRGILWFDFLRYGYSGISKPSYEYCITIAHDFKLLMWKELVVEHYTYKTGKEYTPTALPHTAFLHLFYIKRTNTLSHSTGKELYIYSTKWVCYFPASHISC